MRGIRNSAYPSVNYSARCVCSAGCSVFFAMCESVFKVLVIGDSSVGKTAMVARYCHNRWLAHYKVTLGGECVCVCVCLLAISDT